MTAEQFSALMMSSATPAELDTLAHLSGLVGGVVLSILADEGLTPTSIRDFLYEQGLNARLLDKMTERGGDALAHLRPGSRVLMVVCKILEMADAADVWTVLEVGQRLSRLGADTLESAPNASDIAESVIRRDMDLPSERDRE